MRRRVSVVIVEDDENTRLGLAEAVQSDPCLALLQCFGNLAEAQSFLEQTRPNVLLVDLGLPDGDGSELIRRYCKANGDAQAMVITVFGDEAHVMRAIEAGATGYLIKDADFEEITTAIHQLATGQSPISPSIARHLLKRFAPQGADTVATADTLTPRESEVLDLVAKGYSYAEIGESLNISVHTARTHIRQIYQKLSVRTRGEAVYEAMQRGLIGRPAR